MPEAQADDEEELELNYEKNHNAMEMPPTSALPPLWLAKLRALRAPHATLSDASAFFSDPSGVSSPHSLYLVGASSIHQALATPPLEPDAGANVSAAPMWAVELRGAHTRVVDECGDAVLEDLAGPLASALKLLPSKRSHVARAGCSIGRWG
eukprot:jgi/Tetstr1/438608/TSEL_027159.t1